MQINYLGGYTFRIRLNRQIIVTDPFEEKRDNLMPKTKGDIVTFSYSPINEDALDRIKKDDPFVIEGPGEYEISEVSVFGVPTYTKLEEKEEKGKNNIYIFMAKNLRICHLGRLKDTLSEKQLDEIDGVDILLVPVNAEEAINEKTALKMINQLNPKIVVPMGFDNLDKFLEEGGFQTVERKDRLVTRDTKLPEETKVVILEPEVVK
jgi:L-ascorbate metabolism protein UlaG (beta-lactamase superfamily)